MDRVRAGNPRKVGSSPGWTVCAVYSHAHSTYPLPTPVASNWEAALAVRPTPFSHSVPGPAPPLPPPLPVYGILCASYWNQCHFLVQFPKRPAITCLCTSNQHAQVVQSCPCWHAGKHYSTFAFGPSWACWQCYAFEVLLRLHVSCGCWAAASTQLAAAVWRTVTLLPSSFPASPTLHHACYSNTQPE